MNKILIPLLILSAILLSGCIQESNPTTIQTVGGNNSGEIISGNSNSFNLQSNEKVMWFDKEYGFIPSNQEAEYKITVFSQEHNITKVITQKDEREVIRGYYVIYKD